VIDHTGCFNKKLVIPREGRDDVLIRVVARRAGTLPYSTHVAMASQVSLSIIQVPDRIYLEPNT
jgi:hypothetical protein